MSFGFEVYNASGAKTFGMDAEGGLFLGTFSVGASGSDVVQTYPYSGGRTIGCVPVGQSATYGGFTSTNISLCDVVIDYGLGYPRVTATPRGRASTVYVFTQ